MDAQGQPDGSMGRIISSAPDPSALTIALMSREVEQLKNLVSARLDALEKAQDLFQENITRVPTDTDKQIKQLKELVYETFRTVEKTTEERFKNVDSQFSGRDTALSAALQAAKEAVGEQNKSFTVSIDKSEKATLEQITQLRLLIDSYSKTTADKVEVLQGWQDRREGWGLGQTAEVVDRRSSSSDMRGNISIAVSVILFVLFIVDKIPRGI